MQDINFLREIGVNAALKSSNALSELLKKRVILKPSFIDLTPVHEIHKNIFLRIEKIGVMIFSRLRGDIEGELIFLLDEKTAYRMINLSNLGHQSGMLGKFTELGVSTLKEIGHIVIGSYLTALSEMLEVDIPPPMSTFLSGPLEQIFLDVIYFPYASVKHFQRYCIQTDFEVPLEGIKGNLSLALTMKG